MKRQVLYRIVFLILLASIACACNFDGNNMTNRLVERNDSVMPPTIVKAGDPIVLEMLQAAEPPDTIDLSEMPAPVEIPAGFYVEMENFNTQHGLALSSILSSIKDRYGNIWFGSSGNGVSRFDGTVFTNFTSAHGLIHNFISTVMEDRNGNIWFGTYGGISKYNGVSFENFTIENGLPDNYTMKIFQDSKGTIWVGTAAGACQYIPIENRDGIIAFNTFENEQDAPRNNVKDIIESQDGKIMFATRDGVQCAKVNANGKVKFFNYSDKFGLNGRSANAIAEDSHGAIWVGTPDAVLRFLPGQDSLSEKFFDPILLSDSLFGKSVQCIFLDSQDNIWIGAYGGVARYIETTDSFVTFNTDHGLAMNRVNCITQDNSGSLWFGTHGGGVNRYDGESMIEYATKQGLVGNAVLAINRDTASNMWFAPTGSGIVKYVQKEGNPYHGTYVSYTEKQGLISALYDVTVADNQGNIYFGCHGGITKFVDNKLINFTEKSGLIDNNVTAMYTTKLGKLWIGSYSGGVSIFDGNSFISYTPNQGLIHKTVWSILEDNSGVMWFATRGGLSRFDGETFINFTKDQGLADTKLSTITQDRNGNILIGTWGGGLSVIKNENVELLASGQIDFKTSIFDNFSTAQGLANDVVYQILEDKMGNIIIGTNVGFTILKGGIASAKGEIALNGFENFNEGTGYSVKDISNNYSMHLGEPGVVWAGTGDKVVRFDYRKIHLNETVSRVILQNIKLNNEPISWRSLEWVQKNEKKIPYVKHGTPAYITDELLTFDKKITTTALNAMIDRYHDVKFDSIHPFYAIPQNLKLPYTDNNITFTFAEVEATRPNLIKYQYILEGYDDYWSLESEKNTANFGNIREGKYTFKVRAKSNEGAWGESLEYTFQVNPPWFRTWYAFVGYVLLILIGLYYLDIYLSRRVLDREHQKALRSELKHAKEIEKAYTKLKATQVQLVHSEKMASLGQLTAGIAHEIKNPLNFVTNFSEVSAELLAEMEEEIDNGNYIEAKEISHDVIENLKKINSHGKRADAIVKGMLQHSRTSTGAMEWTDINALCDEYLRLAYHGLRAKDKSFNATMKTEFDESIDKVEIVPQDIGRVVLNLITNAFYACNEKSKLQVASATESGGSVDFEPTVTVGTKMRKSVLEIRVSDNGNGIPEAILAKIFQPFFTTKPSGEGTGLGLSLSYDIIIAHNGELKVETEKGKYTEFKILIPTNNTQKS